MFVAMNTLLNKALLITLGATLLLNTSCKKDDDDNSSATPAVSNEVTYKVNGTATKASTVTATTNSNILVMNAQTASPAQTLAIQFGTVTAAGAVSNATVTYNTTTTAVWSSFDFSGTGTCAVTLTEYNTTTRKMSGTFTATLVPLPFGSTATGNKAVTEGKFTNVSF
jgi:hypothetical protein